MGDPGGIGPEIAVKAALDKRVRAICEPVLVGAKDALEAHAVHSRNSVLWKPRRASSTSAKFTRSTASRRSTRRAPPSAVR